uniref:BHLH domain-containing protein n=1 Tax=Globodera rostochiensis TaxID=31243 RepID=A0A914IG27_GLORO
MESGKYAGGVNGAFVALRKRIPTFPFEKRLSKIDTLNLACAYINLLEEILSTEEHPAIFLERSIVAAKNGGTAGQTVWGTSDLLSRLEWINWNGMGMQPPSNSHL